MSSRWERSRRSDRNTPESCASSSAYSDAGETSGRVAVLQSRVDPAAEARADAPDEFLLFVSNSELEHVIFEMAASPVRSLSWMQSFLLQVATPLPNLIPFEEEVIPSIYAIEAISGRLPLVVATTFSLLPLAADQVNGLWRTHRLMSILITRDRTESP